MPFTWNSLPKVGKNLTPTKVKEIRGKVDTLCDNISISRPTWKTINPNDYIETKLQDEIDRVDDNNYCRTEKSSQFLSEHNPEDSNVYTTQDSYYYGTQVTTDNSSEYTGYDGSNDITINISNYADQNTWKYYSNYGDHNFTI